MVFIENNQQKIQVTDEIINLIKEVIERAIRYENIDFKYEVNVYLVDNELIREYNRDYRNIDKETDVLSFPMIDFNKREKYKVEKTDFDPETNCVLLGDIVLSLEKALEQSKEYGHSFEREIAFLTVHSVLHLLGYDHEKEEERIVMRNKEEDILKSMSLVR
ncbi:probable rRNA maturation factor [Caloramator fervidus]|uniref:Endoribonuclease YbeY n=1 Tax=Caloramator fervidus TaxID=29344 RepID=A0A1H5UGN5_9CLOT|nr:rRNA maturation RNase YbeY [Caloramator fervidus]SEF74194.1 probable rRNA maturation factor [Caloramator fervidus]